MGACAKPGAAHVNADTIRVFEEALTPEKVRLITKDALYVRLVLLCGIRYLGDAERLTELRPECLHADLRQELMQLFPSFGARVPQRLG